MFHEAIKLKYNKGTEVEVTFLDGKVKTYDMRRLFKKYPQLSALKDRNLFKSGRLDPFGITWNDELDIDAETIYQEGETIREEKITSIVRLGCQIAEARGRAGMTQMDLARATGIDQSDISKIERGKANPSVSTIERIAKAINASLNIEIK
ncbi:MAG: helix-turn-helix domain-containing protein [Clostridia bacterium]|nr:helix-turn-helix domain-containing protein [Clostridia bacterium]